MSDPLTPTLEDLLGYKTSDLVAMSDEKLLEFFAASLEVCPPVMQDYVHPSVVEKAMKGGGPDLRRQMETSDMMRKPRVGRPSSGPKPAAGAYGKGLREELAAKALQEKLNKTKAMLKELDNE